MWREDGFMLSGWYGTWRGEQVELSPQGINEGKWKLVRYANSLPSGKWVKGGVSEWYTSKLERYIKRVPSSEISDPVAIDAYGVIRNVKVRLLAEDEERRFAIESDIHSPPNYRDDLAQKYGLEYYDDRRSFAFGWVPAEDVLDITIERREIVP